MATHGTHSGKGHSPICSHLGGPWWADPCLTSPRPEREDGLSDSDEGFASCPVLRQSFYLVTKSFHHQILPSPTGRPQVTQPTLEVSCHL